MLDRGLHLVLWGNLSLDWGKQQLLWIHATLWQNQKAFFDRFDFQVIKQASFFVFVLGFVLV